MLLVLLGLTLSAEPNLLPNPDFAADPVGWNLPAQVTLDPTVGRGDSRSLKLENHDADVYPLASISVDALPGRTYLFSGWVKTQGVAGTETGATVCLQASGPHGFIGGGYPPGRRGDNDWYRVEHEYTIPASATSVTFTVYLRQGCTGVAWFDDLEVVQMVLPPLSAVLAEPNYRGQLRADGAGTIAVNYSLADPLPDDLTPAELYLELVLRQGDTALRRERWTAAPETSGAVRLTAGRLEPGSYDFDLRLLRTNDDTELGRWTTALTALPADAPRPVVDIDDGGFAVVDEQRFFPLGLYMDQVKEADLQVIAAGGFNSIMPYPAALGTDEQVQARLDAVAAAGLRIILSIKDYYAQTDWAPAGLDTPELADEYALGVVRKWRDHPALLAWYINDELPLTMHEQLARRHQLVAAADPEHPTWAVLYQVESLARYADTADVLGTDPYPIPARLPAVAGEWTTTTKATKGSTSAVWQVPQIFDWASYPDQGAREQRPPTLGEMRSMTYQCLAAGATGLIYYSFFDLRKFPETFDQRWADVTQVAAEVNEFKPWLLGAGVTRLAVGPLASDADPLVYGRAWAPPAGGRQSLVLAANGGDEEAILQWNGTGTGEPLVKHGAAEITATQIVLPPRGSVAFLVTEPAD